MLGGREAFAAFHDAEGNDRVMDVSDAPTPRRMTDEDALVLANELLGEGVVGSLKGAPRAQRIDAVRRLKANGLGTRQIQRLTGISLGTISKA